MEHPIKRLLLLLFLFSLSRKLVPCPTLSLVSFIVLEKGKKNSEERGSKWKSEKPGKQLSLVTFSEKKDPPTSLSDTSSPAKLAKKNCQVCNANHNLTDCTFQLQVRQGA